MTVRRVLVVILVLAALAVLLLWLRVGLNHPAHRLEGTSVRARTETGASVAPAPSAIRHPPSEISPEPPSHLADELNAPAGTIRRDLEILNEVFGAWRTNFPREGNPVGENAEITSALTGDNRFRFAFIPKTHRALNAQGELCDRWGTPFRFHQLSGEQMEIFSAGPDRKFGTADDAAWSFDR